MSWSISFIGTPDNLVAALNDRSDKLSGSSKQEFDAALPQLKGLIGQNYAAPGEQMQIPLLELTASGHTYFTDGKATYSTCNVSLKSLGSQLV